MSEIDLRKAILGQRDWFPPLTGVKPSPLADLLAQREHLVNAEAHLLVVERPGGVIALLAPQMAYHHVAQDQFPGDPWMATF